jgi:hypothetical protein
MLVELNFFNEILVNFLIVGHTHTSIDQYFSVLSRKIREASWIGSPLTFAWLIQHAHSTEFRPSVVRELTFIYDVVGALSPYINNDVHYYQKPHCLRFLRLSHSGICIMQYKDFSDMITSDFQTITEEWKPKLPPNDLITGSNSLYTEE